jgi:hypothetical protein
MSEAHIAPCTSRLPNKTIGCCWMNRTAPARMAGVMARLLRRADSLSPARSCTANSPL